MAGFVNVKFDQFFDRRTVLARMTKKERKVLGGTGAFGRTAVKRSIRKGGKRKKTSDPGKPPRFHVRGRESLKDRIFFGLSRDGGSVDIGPEQFNARGGGKGGSLNYRLIGATTIPELLEKGGVRVVRGRGRGRNFRSNGRPVRQTYRPRPFVGESTDAFKRTTEKMAELMEAVSL